MDEDEKNDHAPHENEKQHTERENEQLFHDMIDDDLFEYFTEEERAELVEEARVEAFKKQQAREERPQRRRASKWVLWSIVFGLCFYMIALIPQTFSVPAFKFLSVSHSLSQQSDIQAYKEAVVVIETEDGKGTGFSINSSGSILTNYHVVEDQQQVSVIFPDAGMYKAEVAETYPDIDVAVLELEGGKADFPTLDVADEFELQEEEPIYFIGNPLKFSGIANEGKVIDYINVEDKEKQMVMLDAPVYRGNSGSPVIDKNGKVIGIIYATTYEDDEGRVGLFIPIDYVHEAREDNP
ncbi:MAG TPA: serine protease [Pseudogracilibacillus sp.]|nr:serine protease [Pseudogracilibacillus sp.]